MIFALWQLLFKGDSPLKKLAGHYVQEACPCLLDAILDEDVACSVAESGENASAGAEDPCMLLHRALLSRFGGMTGAR